jgi:chromosome partitioning protein
MKVIVLANRKGGAGKTTLTAHLAVEASRRGQPTALTDTDPEGDLAEWWNLRKDEQPRFVQASAGGLRQVCKEIRPSGIEYLFVDTPPHDVDAVKSVAALADVVLVPAQPSPHDLRRAFATAEALKPLRKDVHFVLNAAKRALVTTDAAETLAQSGTLAPVMVSHRVDFAASMVDGRTVQELDAHGPGAEEIRKLWDYVLSILRK